MIVVDASVLTDALTDDGEVGDANRAALQRDPHWAAQAHLALEVASAIPGRLLGGKILLERATDAVDVLGRLEIDPLDPVVLLPRIWKLRFEPHRVRRRLCRRCGSARVSVADRRRAAGADERTELPGAGRGLSPTSHSFSSRSARSAGCVIKILTGLPARPRHERRPREVS
jgi:hypothetical protein